VTPTHEPEFYYSIALYNSAGELVRTITSNQTAISDPTADFNLSNAVFAPGSPGALGSTTITAAGQTYTWNGTNDGAQAVQNGTYFVKLQYQDMFGHVETETKEVTVLSSGQVYTVRIYNSSGELVDSLAAGSFVSNGPSKLVPDKNTVVVSANSGSAGTVNFDLGNGTTVSWNGTNAQGQAVASGSYQAQLVVQQVGEPATIASAGVTVMSLSGGLLSHVLIGPNPMYLPAPGSGSFAGAPAGSVSSQLVLQLNTPAGVDVEARLYNIAGELILRGDNGGNGVKITMQVGGMNISGGVYMLALTAHAPWGTTERRVMKFVIMR
jgi:flagellar hook assembly protein FlgD